MAEFIKVNLVKGTDRSFPNIGCRKPKGEKAPASLLFNSATFELDTSEIKPGQYRVDVWKNDQKGNDKAPLINISLTRVEGGTTSSKASDSQPEPTQSAVDDILSNL